MARNRADRLQSFDVDGFQGRLTQIIGKESENSFAKRAGISQSGLNRIRRGGIPTLDMAIAIAITGDVSLDWLALGRGPSEKTSSHEVVTPTASLDTILLADVIGELEKWLQEKGSELLPSKKAEVILKIYEYVLDGASGNPMATAPRDIRKLLKLVV